MIRPEDLVASAAGTGLGGTVRTIEYRGRAFFGLAALSDGTEVFFRSELRLDPGQAARFAAAPSQVLVFADTGS
jgi:putative spermidine/putrescine transport system ATP-binding protein